MKYSININQAAYETLGIRISLEAAAVMDALQTASSNTKFLENIIKENKEVFFWFSYDFIISELPLLFPAFKNSESIETEVELKARYKKYAYANMKRAIRIVDELCQLDLISRKTDNKTKGKTYFSFTELSNNIQKIDDKVLEELKKNNLKLVRSNGKKYNEKIELACTNLSNPLYNSVQPPCTNSYNPLDKFVQHTTIQINKIQEIKIQENESENKFSPIDSEKKEPDDLDGNDLHATKSEKKDVEKSCAKKEKVSFLDPANVKVQKFKDPTLFFTYWETWLTYKKEIKNTYKSESSEQTAVEHLFDLANGELSQVEKIIKASICNGWKGLFEYKTQNKPSQAPKIDISDRTRYEREDAAIF